MDAVNIRFLVLVVVLLRLSPHCFERSDKGVGVEGMAEAEPGVGCGIDAATSVLVAILALCLSPLSLFRTL